MGVYCKNLWGVSACLWMTVFFTEPCFSSQSMGEDEQAVLSSPVYTTKELEQSRGIADYLQEFGLSPEESEKWHQALKELKVKDFPAYRDPGLIALGIWRSRQEVLRNPLLASDLSLKCSLGTQVSVSKQPLKGDVLKSIVLLGQTNPFLKSVSFFRCSLDDEDVKLLSSLSHVTEFNLEENCITDKGALSLASHPYLTSLTLWKNQLTSKGAASLAQNLQLRELGLYKNQVGDEGAKALALNTTLTTLDLRQCGITDQGAILLAKNNTLTSLRLRYNTITKQGAQAFLWNKSLRHLELDKNHIPKELIYAIDSMMRGHGYLEFLSHITPGPSLVASPKKQVLILSIDGGGIRGLLPALVLNHLKDRLTTKIGSDFHFAEHVDLMAGTSTGGLICLGLCMPGDRGKPKYTPLTLVQLYREKGKEIFPKSWHKLKLVESAYDPGNLEKMLEECFKEAPLSSCLTHTFLTSYDLNKGQPYIFDSAEARKDPGHNFDIKGAARATSAAPTYFPAVQLTSRAGISHSFVDGGIHSNNPSQLALDKAKELYPGAQEYLLLSLGTGASEKKDLSSSLEKGGMLQWAPKIPGILMNNAMHLTEERVKKEASQDPRIIYIRIQPRLKAGKTALDDVREKTIGRLEALACDVIKDQSEVLEFLINKLHQRYGS